MKVLMKMKLEIWGQRHSLGPLQLTHRGTLGQTKGHKKDKKGKNSRWWKSHEKWIYTLLMCFISNLFQRNWRLPLEGNLWEQETWISYTAKDETEYRKCQNWILLLVNLKVYKLSFIKRTYTYMYVRNITTPLHYLSNFNLSWKDFGFSFGRLGRIRSIITHPLH